MRAPAGSSSPRSSSQATGGGGTVTSATSPYGGPHVSLRSTAPASGGAPSSSTAIRGRSANSAVTEPTALTGSCVGGSPSTARICCSRVGDMPDVASATVGPSPVGDGLPAAGARMSRAVRTRRSRSSPPHSSACARSAATAPGSASAASGPISAASASYGAPSGATARASAACSVNRSRRSRARTTEARVPSAGRELREVVRDRVQQVRARPEQCGQRVVAAGAQILRERARRRRGAVSAHLPHISPARPQPTVGVVLLFPKPRPGVVGRPMCTVGGPGASTLPRSRAGGCRGRV